MRRMNEAVVASLNLRWGTPRDFYRWLCAAVGKRGFTVDVCAEPWSAKCRRYFTREIDGLAQSWAGEHFFWNPEYGDQIGRWVAKARFESMHNKAVGFGVLPSRVDTAWWRDLVEAPAGPLRSSFYVQQTRTFWFRYFGLTVGVYHHDERLHFELPKEEQLARIRAGKKPSEGAPFPTSVVITVPPGVWLAPDLDSKYAYLGGRPPLTLGMPH